MTDLFLKTQKITDRKSFAHLFSMTLNIRGLTRNRFANAAGIPIARVNQFLSPDWTSETNPDPTADELLTISQVTAIPVERMCGWLEADEQVVHHFNSIHGISTKTQAEKEQRREHWTEVARQEAEAKGVPFVSTAAEHKARKERRAAERQQGLQKAA